MSCVNETATPERYVVTEDYGEGRDEDENADGAVDSRETHAHDKVGNRLDEQHDDDADGTTDERWTNTYDAHGNALTERHDADADGIDDDATTSVYDGDVTEKLDFP